MTAPGGERGGLRAYVMSALVRNGTAGVTVEWLSSVTSRPHQTISVILHRLAKSGFSVVVADRHLWAGHGILPDREFDNDNEMEAA